MIGIDVGGSFIKGVRWPTNGAGPAMVARSPAPDDWLRQIAELASFLAGEPGEAIGVGIAGLVRWPAGELIWAPHLAGTGVPIRAWLEFRLGRRVAVDNDANCAALAESVVGAARGVGSAVVLTLGTGIGAGIIVGGEVFRGASFAGEAGHMTMIPGGEECACGRSGCWETVVSGRVLAANLQQLCVQEPGGRLAALAASGGEAATILAAAAREGIEEAAEVLAQSGRWLGRGISNLIALLDPEVVVVGGGAIQGAGREIIEAARAEVGRVLEGAEHRPSTPIEPARAGLWAGAMGAAMLVSAYPFD